MALSLVLASTRNKNFSKAPRVPVFRCTECWCCSRNGSDSREVCRSCKFDLRPAIHHFAWPGSASEHRCFVLPRREQCLQKFHTEQSTGCQTSVAHPCGCIGSNFFGSTQPRHSVTSLDPPQLAQGPAGLRTATGITVTSIRK